MFRIQEVIRQKFRLFERRKTNRRESSRMRRAEGQVINKLSSAEEPYLCTQSANIYQKPLLGSECKAA